VTGWSTSVCTTLAYRDTSRSEQLQDESQVCTIILGSTCCQWRLTEINFKGCRLGKAPLRSGRIASHKHRPNSYSGNGHDSPYLFHCQCHPYYTSNMADAASGSADKSVQVKLVLLGALSESLINPFGS